MIVTGQAVVEWVAKRTNEFGNFGCAVGIGIERNGALIAGVAYNEFNGVNLNMHVAALPGVIWAKPEYLRAWFDYPFNQAGVRWVTGLVGEGNLTARKFDEHVGFTLETRLKDRHPTGDLLIYSMARKDCRWISQDFEKPLAKAA